MESMTEKFSVFDFFNLLICGTIFLFVLGIIYYPQTWEKVLSISGLMDDAHFLLIIIVVAIIACSFIIGSVLQEIGYLVIEKKLGMEKKMIANCLNEDGIFTNSLRLKSLQEKARDYLRISKKSSKRFTEEQCLTFFAYCIYFLYVRELVRKTEKIREAQALLELCVCEFAIIPLANIFILLIQVLFFDTVSCPDWKWMIFISVMCYLLSYIFYDRYKCLSQNRILIVLGIYDACKDN
jgi:uncharacterized membrane protein (DUF106 family)